MGKFVDISNTLESVSYNIDSASNEAQSVEDDIHSESTELNDLEARLAALQKKMGITVESNTELCDRETEATLIELNNFIDSKIGIKKKIEGDKIYELQKCDYLVSTIAGGLAVAVDFLVVKTPKTVTLGKGNDATKVEGSPLTGFLRSLGHDSDSKTWKWIEWLEKHCKVPYDKSIDPLVKGLCPSSHRLHSAAHDPSPAGLLWAIKDVVNGTFTTIDKNGVIRVEKIGKGMGPIGLLVAPVLWLGHIISDIFTSAGIPIPGWTYLQLLQFGSFGDKERTIADLARYMYYSGYDVRHLVTMSTTQAVIHLVVRVYHFLVNVKPERMKQQSLLFEKEYGRVKNNIKLHRMLFLSNSIALAGNISKIAIYEGNPLAINIVVWGDFVKESVTQVQIENRLTKDFEKVIEQRHVIDENFEQLNNDA